MILFDCDSLWGSDIRISTSSGYYLYNLNVLRKYYSDLIRMKGDYQLPNWIEYVIV